MDGAALNGSDRLGLWQPKLEMDGQSGLPYGSTLYGSRQYELKNHIGNVMAVITDKKIWSGHHWKAEQVTATDYYSFGMQMPDKTFRGINAYRYGFNGKENDNDVWNTEGGQQDYGMRVYDPRVGRFLSTDPISKEYPELTPYQFSNCNPILNIDVDGLEGAPSTQNWNKFTNQRLRNLAIKRGVFQYAASRPNPGLTFNRIVGAAFENAFLTAFGLERNGKEYQSVLRVEKVRPDGLSPSTNLLLGKYLRPEEVDIIPEGTFYEGPDFNFIEVKTSKSLTKGFSNFQLAGMIDVLSRMNSIKGKNSKQIGGFWKAIQSQVFAFEEYDNWNLPKRNRVRRVFFSI